MHHKPINPARRDGGRGEGRGQGFRDGWGIRQREDTEERTKRCKLRWWLTAERKQANTKREREGERGRKRKDQDGAERMSGGRDCEIQRVREREKKKQM